jgi:hypothetical protein
MKKKADHENEGKAAPIGQSRGLWSLEQTSVGRRCKSHDQLLHVSTERQIFPIRRLEHFQEKRTPVRVKKMRENKKLERDVLNDLVDRDFERLRFFASLEP